MSVLEDRSALEAIPNKIAWEDAEQGPGMVMSTLASEKNRLFLGQLHDQVFLLQLPESLSLLFSCAN